MLVYLIAEQLVNAILVLVVSFLAFVTFRALQYRIRYGHLRHLPYIMPDVAAPFMYDQRPGWMQKMMDCAYGLRDQEGKFPPVMHMGIFINPGSFELVPALLVTDLDAAREIFNDVDRFPKSHLYVVDLLSYEILSVFLGRGLLTASGDLWHKERRLLTPLFHFRQLKTHMLKSLCDEIPQMIQHLEASPVDTYHEAFGLHSRFTMKALISSAFADSFDHEWMVQQWTDLNCDFFKNLPVIAALGVPLWESIPFLGRTFKNCRSNIRGRIRDTIRLRQTALKAGQTAAGSDLLSLLLAAGIAQNDVDEELVIDECMNFLFAGHDTTANTMSWWSFFMAKHPDILDKVSEEAREVLGADAYENHSAHALHLEHADLARLPYTRATLQETLRMRPPVGHIIRRVTRESEDIAGYTVPQGALAAVSLMYLQNCSSNYSDALTFKPERFLSTEENDVGHGRNAYAYAPFSAGPRNCIGQKFAMQEMILMSAEIASRFRLDLDPSHTPRVGIRTTHTAEEEDEIRNRKCCGKSLVVHATVAGEPFQCPRNLAALMV